MAFNPTSPVTGGSQVGLTTPTYTLVADFAPDVNAKQFAVSALGGTQTGVGIHSASSPFTITMWRPKQIAILGKPNPNTGLLPSVPMNQYKVIVRKGVVPLAGQPVTVMLLNCTISVPAGSDIADPNSIAAALSLAFGALNQQSSGIGDAVKTAIV